MAINRIENIDFDQTTLTQDGVGGGGGTQPIDDIRIDDNPTGGNITTKISKYKITFKISGKGAPISILKNGNKDAEFFPRVGVTEYEDVSGTKYKVRSSDLTSYRISEINVSNINESKVLKANVGESLEVDIDLNLDYTLNITTEEIFKGTPALNPQIELVKTEARTYNLNSKAGVPLMFKKNKDVQAITVIIGDDVLEFDDLDTGDLCGITIPHSSFDKIGKYNIKIYPFSFDDYEKQVRPAEKADTIEPKKVTPKFDVKEEVKLPEVTLSDRVNPYKPTSPSTPTGGSGGGGGRVISDPIFEDRNKTKNKPTPNEGDSSFVNRPVDNRNFR